MFRKTNRLDIWDEMQRMQEDMDSMFERFFDWRPALSPRKMLPGPKGTELMASGFRQPLADIYETEKEIVAKVEMPGLNKEDIKINVADDCVEIKAERKAETEKTDKKKGIYRFERSYSCFYRCFALPDNVDSEKIDANYDKGVLELKIPKTGESKKKQIEVKVK